MFKIPYMLTIMGFSVMTYISFTVPSCLNVVSVQEIAPLIPEQIQTIATITDVTNNLGMENLAVNKVHIPHTIGNTPVELNNSCKGYMVYIDFSKTELLKAEGFLLFAAVITYIAFQFGK